MSTKKTPAKKTAAAAKKAPAKKPAAAAKPRTDYKIGTRVKVKRYSRVTGHSEVAGRVVATKEAPTGIKTTPVGCFICVDIGSKQVPHVIEPRPVNVRGF